MRSLLLDTGAFVALLDKSENNHERCADFFKTFTGKVLTTEPVLTETLYLLGPYIKAEKACIDFILKGGSVLKSGDTILVFLSFWPSSLLWRQDSSQPPFQHLCKCRGS